MKKYVINVTNDPKVIDPILKRAYSPATLSFKEGGKVITLKPGESAETNMNGANLAGGGTKRLRLVEKKDIKKLKED